MSPLFFSVRNEKTGTAPQRDSSFSYAHVGCVFYTYVPGTFYFTIVGFNDLNGNVHL